MDITKLACRLSVHNKKINLLIISFLFIGFNSISTVHAAEWQIEPELQLGLVYSDNIALVPNHEAEWDIVLDISPGFDITADGRRLDLALSYTLQNLYYTQGTAADTRYQQWDSSITAELLDNHLFLDVDSVRNQQSVSSGPPSTNSNFNVSNRSDFTVLSANPYFRYRMSGDLNVLLRYNYNYIDYDQGAADSTSKSYSGEFGNEVGQSKLKWDLSFSAQKLERDLLATIESKEAGFNMSYKLLDQMSFLVESGYENYTIETFEPLENGSYVSYGLSFEPNRYFTLLGLYGKKYSSARLNIVPSQRTSLELVWQDRDIGLNPGKSWSGNFVLRNRRFNMSYSYDEETTTVQQIQFSDVLSSGASAGEYGSFDLTDELFIRKVSTMTMGFNGAISAMTASLYSEERIFQSNGQSATVDGTTVTWRWRLNFRTNVVFDTNYEERAAILIQDNRSWYGGVRFERALKRTMQASLWYRYTTTRFGDGFSDYKENRILARVTATF